MSLTSFGISEFGGTPALAEVALAVVLSSEDCEFIGAASVICLEACGH